MRAALLALLVFNLALGGALYLKEAPADRVTDPTPLPDAIQLVTSMPVAAVITRCMELGPFDQQEAIDARRMLDAMPFGTRVSAVDKLVSAGWWVYIPPRPSRAEALRRARELDRLGVPEYRVMEDAGATQYAISLGIFKTESAAQKLLGDLVARGVKGARVGPQEQRVKVTLFYLEDSSVESVSGLTQVKAQFSSAQLRQVACPR